MNNCPARQVARETGSAPPNRRSNYGLRQLDPADSDLARALIGLRVERDLLSLTQGVDACTLEGSGVNEYVLAAVLRLNEAEALLLVVEFHGPVRHDLYPFTDRVHAMNWHMIH